MFTFPLEQYWCICKTSYANSIRSSIIYKLNLYYSLKGVRNQSYICTNPTCITLCLTHFTTYVRYHVVILICSRKILQVQTVLTICVIVAVACAANCKGCKANGAAKCDSDQCNTGYRFNADTMLCDGKNLIVVCYWHFYCNVMYVYIYRMSSSDSYFRNVGVI